MKWKRRASNTFIPVFVCLILIDVLPDNWFHHRPLKIAIDPILDVAGLWQGSWNLFSPNVDSENHQLEVEFGFPDGSRQTWSSMDWTRTSSFEKFRRVHEIELYDRIRNDSSRATWSSFCRYAAKNLVPDSSDSRPVIKVSLITVSRPVPPPGVSPLPEPIRIVFHSESLSP